MKKSLFSFKKKEKKEPEANSDGPSTTTPSAPPLSVLTVDASTPAANSAVTEKSSYGQIATNLQNLHLDKQLLPGEREFLQAEDLYNFSKLYEALELYEKAIASGYSAGYFRCWVIHDLFLPEKNQQLVDRYLIGAQKEGLPWCVAQAEQNNITAKYILGCYHFFGIGGEGKNYQKAFKLLKESAHAGHGFAQNLLGVCYEFGYGVTLDLRAAVEWYQQSSQQNISWGEWHLGVCYLYGRGVKKDERKGIALIKSACDKGLADALNELGFCYMKGIGVSKNYKMAAPLFEQSANKGNADAMCSIGACYGNGHGVPTNRAVAIDWYTKAAAKGHETAKMNLVNLKNPQQTVRYRYHWFRY